jgi:hypothetical protein
MITDRFGKLIAYSIVFLILVLGVALVVKFLMILFG